MAKSTSSYLKLPDLGKPKKKEQQTAKKIQQQVSPQKKITPPKANKFMGLSDAEIKRRYTSMSQAEKKANGIAMAKASQANKANKAKKNKPAASKPAASKPKAPTTQSDPQRNTGSGRDGSFGLGTSGKGRPSGKSKPTDKPAQYDPKGPTVLRKKTEPKKTEVKGSRRRFQPSKKTDVKQAIAKFSDALRLTYKKGQLVRRGNKVYRSDGKGGFTLVHNNKF